jgi:hypothetical protein
MPFSFDFHKVPFLPGGPPYRARNPFQSKFHDPACMMNKISKIVGNFFPERKVPFSPKALALLVA